MIESDTTFRMAGNSGGHHHPTSHDFRLLTTEPSQQTEELLGDLQSLSWLTTVDVPRLQEMATGRLAFNTGAQSSMLEEQLDQRSSMNTVLGHDDTMIPPHSNMQNSYTGLNIQNGNMTGYPGYQSPPAHYYHSHQQLFSPAQTLQQCSPTSLYSSPSYSDQNLYEQHHTITSYRTQDQDQDLLQTKAFPKPIYSYSCLIAMALKNSQTGSLPVSEIYSFMKEHFPYFKSAPDGWKNSVRHNLSLNKSFEKVENKQGSSSRKGCLWALNPAKIDKMEEEMQKWKRKDLTSIRNSMANPDELDKLITDRPEGCHRKCYDPSMTCVPCSHVLGRTPPLHAVSDFYHNPLIPQPPCRPPHSLYNLYPDVTAEVDTLDPSIMEFAGLWEEMREEGFNLETLGNFNHSPLCLSDCDMTGPSLMTTPAEGLPLVDLQVGGLYTTYTTLDTATGVPSQYITTQGGGQAIALL